MVSNVKRIIGIDLGYARLGYAIVDTSSRKKIKIIDLGVITTSPSLSFQERIGSLYADLTTLFNKFSPHICGVEEVISLRNLERLKKSYAVFGVLNLICHEKNVFLYTFTPSAIKAFITGYGNASKKTMIKTLYSQFLKDTGVTFSVDDTADALGVAVMTAFHLDK